ncbi:hypothetical protein ACIPEL_38935 [Streptomyces griseoviridis]
MRSTTRPNIRRWLAAVAALVGSLVLLIGVSAPAQAAETSWADVGNGARVLSGVYSVTVGGATYEVARGTDNNVWFRYNNGSWHPLGGDNSARTVSPPRIVEFPPGQVMALLRGLDGEIWYSRATNGPANFWAPWTRIGSGARAIGSPLAVLITPNVLHIDVPNDGRFVSYTGLYSFDGVLSQSSSGWRVSEYARLSSDNADIEGDSSLVVYNTGYGRTMISDFYVGTDGHIWEVTEYSDGAPASVRRISETAVCDSGVAAARLGNQTTVATPGQPGFADQQRVLIACIGTDGNVWTSQSSDGGITFGNFSRPSGALAPSTTTPAISPSGTSWTLTISWNGSRSTVFPDHAAVGKRIS